MKKFLDYDLKNGTHGTAEAEWGPHEPRGMKFFEWQYFTAPMLGDNGHRYFILYCLFNFGGKIMRLPVRKETGIVKKDQIPIITIAHICDYDARVYRTTSAINIVSRDTLFDENTGTLQVVGGDRQGEAEGYFSYKGDQVTLKAKNDIYECELNCTGGSRVMWMEDTLKKEGLIIEGKKSDRSFYYSLPQLPYSGWIKYTDNDGIEQKVHVTGEGWVDRQWGEFLTKAWEWTSFRFNDGDRLNTYNFPTGHQVCTFQSADGKTSSYPGFTVIQNGYLRTPKNEWVSWGWDYEVPVKDRHYKLIPYSDKNIVFNPMLSFFEGLSDIQDESGKSVGCAVTESMDIRKMHNGPYDKYNHFPKEQKDKWK